MNVKRNWNGAGVMTVTNGDGQVLAKMTLTENAEIDDARLKNYANFFRDEYGDTAKVNYRRTPPRTMEL